MKLVLNLVLLFLDVKYVKIFSATAEERNVTVVHLDLHLIPQEIDAKNAQLAKGIVIQQIQIPIKHAISVIFSLTMQHAHSLMILLCIAKLQMLLHSNFQQHY